MEWSWFSNLLSIINSRQVDMPLKSILKSEFCFYQIRKVMVNLLGFIGYLTLLPMKYLEGKLNICSDEVLHWSFQIKKSEIISETCCYFYTEIQHYLITLEKEKGFKVLGRMLEILENNFLIIVNFKL